VNVTPLVSDGKAHRVRFDFYNKRFHVSGPMCGLRLGNVVRLTGEKRARFPAITTARSDMKIVGVTRDGRKFVVSNKGHIHGRRGGSGA